MTEKPIVWLGTSLDDLRAFPDRARRAAGQALAEVQEGLEPSNWKPMRTVGPGVNEIRVRVGRDFRVLYVAKFADAVYVLHAFEKNARKTNWSDLEIARRRSATIRRARLHEGGQHEDD